MPSKPKSNPKSKSKSKKKKFKKTSGKTKRGAVFKREALLEECGDTKKPSVEDDCWQKNGHCQQNKNVGFHYNFDLMLRRNAPQLGYERTVKCGDRSTLHIGQRKLLLTEIYFLTNFAKNNNNEVLVYAGSAPGNHFPLIIKLFPNINQFILIDPAKFDKRLVMKAEKSKNIKIRREFFVDKTAEELGKKISKENKDILFLSDIRLDDDEDSIKQDMENQFKWSKTMNAKVSMMKFRLPYESDANSISVHPEGKILIQPWAAATSTETRLIYNPKARKRKYKDKLYEDQMFWHNRRGRPSCYKTPDKLPIDYRNGLDHCWDCTCEITILNQYLKRFRPEMNKKERAKEINRMIDSITKLLNRPLSHIPTNKERVDRKKRFVDIKKEVCSSD